MEYCERFENPRKPDIVKRNLDSVQKALQEREKRFVLANSLLRGLANFPLKGTVLLSKR